MICRIRPDLLTTMFWSNTLDDEKKLDKLYYFCPNVDKAVEVTDWMDACNQYLADKHRDLAD